ncbi:hypothetical protein [Caballeronia sp. LjRoot31]
MLTPRSGVYVPPTLDIVNYDFRLRDNYDGRSTFQLSRTTIR